MKDDEVTSSYSIAHGIVVDEFQISAREASVVSFDIFDTLLVRIFSRPTDLFYALSERLDAQHISFAKRFPQERIAAERRVREQCHVRGGNEITFAEIYAELAVALKTDPSTQAADVQAAMLLECNLEVASVRADPQIKAAFDNLVSQKARVVLVSDMYLPIHCIEAMLTRAGIHGYSRLYLSNVCNSSKANGSIWQYIRDDLKLASDDLIVHLGDNESADGIMARRFGVQSFLLTEPGSRLPTLTHMPDEQWFNRCCFNILQQSIAQHRDDPSISPYWLSIAHMIVLPAVLGMAGHVRDVADREGTDRVFFLARDGLIFRKAYEAAWRRPSDAPSHYIWASRRCLNMAMIENLDEPDIEFLLSGASSLSVADFLRRIDLDPSDPSVHSAIEKHFPDSMHVIATKDDRTAMRALFYDLKLMIQARAALERGPLLAHLNEHGLFDGSGVVVDLGWHGTMQRSLIELGRWQTGESPDLAGAYLGTVRKRVRVAGGKEMFTYGWLFNEDDPDEHSSIIRKSIEVIELLFSAPESGVKHIQTRDGRSEPVSIFEEKEAHRLEIASIIHDAVEAACIALRPFIEYTPQQVFKMMTLENLKNLLTKPTPADIAMFQTVSHAEGFGIARYKPIIQRHSVSPDRWTILDQYRKSFWPAGYRASLNWKDNFTIEIMLLRDVLRNRFKRGQAGARIRK